jgi:hypothetical protein
MIAEVVLRMAVRLAAVAVVQKHFPIWISFAPRSPMSIPVICDRCRATGIAGEADFSHLGDLLDFAPVPRKTERADGWSPEKQRAFIAALSPPGSKRQAALAIAWPPSESSSS